MDCIGLQALSDTSESEKEESKIKLSDHMDNDYKFSVHNNQIN